MKSEAEKQTEGNNHSFRKSPRNEHHVGIVKLCTVSLFVVYPWTQESVTKNKKKAE